MEILNNIWLALNTPNELLVRLLSVPLLFLVEMPLSFYLIISVFNIEYTKKQKIIYILSTSIVAIIASFFVNWPFNIILNYLSSFVILFFVIKIAYF